MENENKSKSQNKGRHSRKKTYKDYLRPAILIICAALMVVSFIKASSILKERKTSRDSYQAIQAQVVSTPAPTPSPVQTTPSPQEGDTPEIPEETPMPPLEKPPIEVDFTQLLAQNKDVVGWLYCGDTVLNLPVAQGPDNAYYVNRLLDGRDNVGGTLFIDFRNERDFSHYNTIMFGHSMADKSMFGVVLFYKEAEFFAEHPYMYLLTPTQNYKIEILGGVVTTTADPAYQCTGTKEERDELLSRVCPDVEIDDEAHILTMSTCSYEFEGARYLLCGIMHPIG